MREISLDHFVSSFKMPEKSNLTSDKLRLHTNLEQTSLSENIKHVVLQHLKKNIMNKQNRRILSSLIRRVFLRDKRNLYIFWGVLVINTLAALLEGLSFGCILVALSFLGGNLDNLTPLLNGLHLSPTFIQSLTPQLGFISFAIGSVVLQILRSALWYIGQVTNTIINAHIQTSMQKEVYAQILKFSFPFLSRYKIGDLIEYTKIPMTIVNVVIDTINRMIVSIMTIVANVVVMFYLSPQLSFLALLIFGLCGLFLKKFIRKISTVSCMLTNELVELSKQVVQSLQGLRAVFTFDRQEDMVVRTDTILNKIAKYTKKVGLWNNSIGPINEIMGVALVGLFLLLGQSTLSKTGETNIIPILITFITIVYRLNNKAQVIITSLSTIAGNWGSVLRLEDILSDHNKEFSPNGGVSTVSFTQEIRFESVAMNYFKEGSDVLKNINLAIPKGAMIALVGSSGSGKSSIIDLLVRLYEPTEGTIWIDQEDLRSFDLTKWRAYLGVVSQDSFMFNDTIAENIRFGKTAASQAELENAATLAGAHEFIERLPEKYQTIVGERGYRLSGGERQRLSLARALVRDPQLLILDEATSNLDSYSEKIIQDALLHLKGNKTLIIVAHRLSTIAMADRIYVLEKGEIVESGSHQALLNLKGYYANYWSIQTAGLALPTLSQ